MTTPHRTRSTALRQLVLGVCISVLCVAFSSPAASAAAPGLLPLHGHLGDAAGVSLDGPVDVAFALYTGSEGGAALWSSPRVVDVADGAFVAYLGDEEALDLDLFRVHEELWLGVAVGDEPEMDRIQLGSAAWAGFAQACGDAATLGGISSADFVQGPLPDPNDELDVSALTALLDGVYLAMGWAPTWGDLDGMPAGFADGVDDDTTYEAGGGLTLDAGTFALEPAGDSELGGVMATTCSAGDFVTGVTTAGEVVCDTLPAGTGGDPGTGAADPPPPSLSSPQQWSATVQITPRILTAADGWVYWSAVSTEIRRTPLAGGPTSTVATAGSLIKGLAADATHVYWSTSAGEVYNQPIAGGDAMLLAGDFSGDINLALDGDTLFMAGAGGGGIKRVNKAGGPVFEVTDTLAGAMIVDGDEVYFVAVGGGVKKTTLEGSETTILPALRCGGLERIGDTLFTLVDNGLVRVGIDGSAPRVFATPGNPASITSRGDHVFWVDDSTTLGAMHAEGDAMWVVSGTVGRNPLHLAALDDALFFIAWFTPGDGQNEGHVFRVADPWGL